ncbi:hypothetical protein FJT64_011282 [Amphibalanus amphitrite]|uniref:Uncharacterized protein n=1 Tax=Amphibalanus amphitrite TaxID=1232801 RepID=A0A6A4VJ96_AMPAM|nr:hypothetical protein FJT64_011282 [Amphibalanus amphitrite]
MQRLMFLALLVVAVAAAFSSQTRQGRRWVWPSSDAERFSGFSYRSLGDRRRTAGGARGGDARYSGGGVLGW